MDGAKCILQVRGVRPFFSDKFDIEKHHNYKYLADSNPKYIFDIVNFLKKEKKSQKDVLRGVNKLNTKIDRIIITDETKPTPPKPEESAPPTDTIEYDIPEYEDFLEDILV